MVVPRSPVQSVAAIQAKKNQQEEDGGDVVAAMASKKRPNFNQGQPKGQQAARKGGKSMGLCWAHQKYGEYCHRCADKKNCTWLRN